jgi:TRAP transporter TAXI family solute receptor
MIPAKARLSVARHKDQTREDKVTPIFGMAGLGRGLAAAVAFAACLAQGADPAEARNLKAESSNAAGLTTIVLQVTARALRDTDLSLQINPDQTLTRTALKLGAGKLDVGIVPPAVYLFMKSGKGPFKDNPEQAQQAATNIRSLYAFAAGVLHPIVWADSDIKSMADFKGKRVYLGPPGGSAAQQIGGLIEMASGLKADVDYEAIKMDWGASISAFQDGQFDVLMDSTAVGSAAITQLALTSQIRMIGLDEEQAKSQAYKDFLGSKGLVAGGIPPGIYSGQVNGDQFVTTYAYTMTVSVTTEMTDDEAYALTAAFWDNLAESQKDIALMSAIEMRPFDGNPIPLHPGAIRYYREKGLEIPAALLGAGG